MFVKISSDSGEKRSISKNSRFLFYISSLHNFKALQKTMFKMRVCFLFVTSFQTKYKGICYQARVWHLQWKENYRIVKVSIILITNSHQYFPIYLKQANGKSLKIQLVHKDWEKSSDYSILKLKRLLTLPLKEIKYLKNIWKRKIFFNLKIIIYYIIKRYTVSNCIY